MASHPSGMRSVDFVLYDSINALPSGIASCGSWAGGLVPQSGWPKMTSRSVLSNKLLRWLTSVQVESLCRLEDRGCKWMPSWQRDRSLAETRTSGCLKWDKIEHAIAARHIPTRQPEWSSSSLGTGAFRTLAGAQDLSPKQRSKSDEVELSQDLHQATYHWTESRPRSRNCTSG